MYIYIYIPLVCSPCANPCFYCCWSTGQVSQGSGALIQEYALCLVNDNQEKEGEPSKEEEQQEEAEAELPELHLPQFCLQGSTTSVLNITRSVDHVQLRAWPSFSGAAIAAPLETIKSRSSAPSELCLKPMLMPWSSDKSL